MDRLYRYLRTACNVTVKALVAVGVTFIIVMTVIMWIQVIMRYVFNVGLPWAEEIAKYLMVWSAMLGSAVVLIENEHISVNFLYEKIPEGLRRWVKLGHILLAMGLFMVMTYQGWYYAYFGLIFKSPATGIPRFWPYLSICMGGLLMLFFTVCQLIIHLYEAFLKNTGPHPGRLNR